ncbi:Caudovirus prohead protease [Pirellula sp. SH-Sr6A]|uniref:HK97 family phage prohead protease n=1 Tax=Pirellula sp. SH-Sr6A TaxID=1632865 RepID=UPI00078EE87B|nr:HK97 family phage prohead protease [Pirellula sp. SH-Sr6A]AMV33751.1 Caudovirus prohead protease [Pirellula sp. SH-Sr6A]
MMHHRRFSVPNMKSTERRLVIQKRNATSDSNVIRGYGAVFYNESDPQTEYWLWDDLVERIMPGAFDRVIKEGQDVRCLFNHDMNYVLGRTLSGTCRINTDGVGLYYECDESTNDPQWQSVAEKLTHGDVTGSSFSFYPSATIWETIKAEGKTFDVRWIKEIGVCYDVGPVTFPAYNAATSSRSICPQERTSLLGERNEFWRSRDDVSVRLRELEKWE